MTIHSPTQSAVDYVKTLQSAFDAAEQQAGRSDRFYRLGGRTICLQFAGTVLIPYMAAFSHLEIQPVASPDLVICLWEQASTHTPVPLPPGAVDVVLPVIESVEGYGSLMFWRADHLRIGFYQETQTLSVLDLQQNLAFYALSDVRQLPYFEPASPLRLILSWWLSTQSLQMVHAAAVGTATGGVLLVGKGGSGKSTSALASLSSELLYAGDDYCAVTNGITPSVFSLYSTGKLKGRADFQRFPDLLPKVSNLDRLDTEKAIFFLNDHFPEKLMAGFPLKAILLPKVTSTSKTCLYPISTIAGLRALAPSTLLQLTGTNQSNLTFLAALTKQLPCYSLELGGEIQAIPDVILDLLSRGGAL